GAAAEGAGDHGERRLGVADGGQCPGGGRADDRGLPEGLSQSGLPALRGQQPGRVYRLGPVLGPGRSSVPDDGLDMAAAKDGAERIVTAALLVIGDEILSGRTKDKN